MNHFLSFEVFDVVKKCRCIKSGWRGVNWHSLKAHEFLSANHLSGGYVNMYVHFVILSVDVEFD